MFLKVSNDSCYNSKEWIIVMIVYYSVAFQFFFLFNFIFSLTLHSQYPIKTFNLCVTDTLRKPSSQLLLQFVSIN